MVIETIPDCFIVNKYLTLKYEREQTNIYVNGRFFKQCKFILLNISQDVVESLDRIESIDEAVEKLGQSTEDFSYLNIPSKTEFWGHCSNMQVWHENNYDTRLLHSNLAFPLLRSLTEAGDALALNVFKEEIIKRFTSECSKVITYLLEEKYDDYLDLDKVIYLMLHSEDAQVLEDIQDYTGTRIKIIRDVEDTINLDPSDISHFSYKKKRIIGLECKWINQPPFRFPKSILKLSKLTKLIINIGYNNNFFKDSFSLPTQITDLRNLDSLWLYTSNLRTVPNTIGELSNLKKLIIYNKLGDIKLPNSINNLRLLEYLELEARSITIPNSIKECAHLHSLFLKGDSINMPESIKDLNSLVELSIRGKVKALPKNIIYLKNLTLIILPKNTISESIKSWLRSLGLIHIRTVDAYFVFKRPE